MEGATVDKLLFLLLLLPALASAGSLTLTWSPVETDINGAAIDPRYLTYHIYVDSGEGYKETVNTTETSYQSNDAYAGVCLSIFLRSKRHDADPPLMSDPSNTVAVCYDQTGKPVGVEPDYPGGGAVPRPPESPLLNLRIER